MQFYIQSRNLTLFLLEQLQYESFGFKPESKGLTRPQPCLHLKQEACIALLMDVCVSLFFRPGEHFRSDLAAASTSCDLKLMSDEGLEGEG